MSYILHQEDYYVLKQNISTNESFGFIDVVVNDIGRILLVGWFECVEWFPITEWDNMEKKFRKNKQQSKWEYLSLNDSITLIK